MKPCKTLTNIRAQAVVLVLWSTFGEKSERANQLYYYLCCDNSEGKNVSCVNHGATIYPHMQFLTSMRDIWKTKRLQFQIGKLMHKILESYLHQYTAFAKLMGKRKRCKAQTELDDSLSTKDF